MSGRKVKLVHSDGLRMLVVVFDKGDEVVSGLTRVAHEVARDGTTRGGRLLEGRVWSTLEVVLTEAPADLRRRSDPETGLPLIDLARSG